MATAFRVKVVNRKEDYIAGVRSVVIKLKREGEGSEEEFETTLPYSNDYKDDTDKLLSDVFEQYSTDVAAYIYEKDELRHLRVVFTKEEDDYPEFITEKNYESTSKPEEYFVELYRRIRGEVAK
jgi:hypothetical protein